MSVPKNTTDDFDVDDADWLISDASQSVTTTPAVVRAAVSSSSSSSSEIERRQFVDATAPTHSVGFSNHPDAVLNVLENMQTPTDPKYRKWTIFAGVMVAGFCILAILLWIFVWFVGK